MEKSVKWNKNAEEPEEALLDRHLSVVVPTSSSLIVMKVQIKLEMGRHELVAE